MPVFYTQKRPKCGDYSSVNNHCSVEGDAGVARLLPILFGGIFDFQHAHTRGLDSIEETVPATEIKTGKPLAFSPMLSCLGSWLTHLSSYDSVRSQYTLQPSSIQSMPVRLVETIAGGRTGGTKMRNGAM
jgi:hypothetical protein